MSRPIDNRCLAELAEAIGAPGAAFWREAADAEREEEREDLEGARDELEWIRGNLDGIPEPTKSTRHDETCWQRHARCLADRLLGGEGG